MPMTAEQRERLQAAYARRGLDFGTSGAPPASGYAPTTPIAPADTGLSLTEALVTEPLKGVISGSTGELADWGAHALDSDLLQQNPNNPWPYRVGYVAGSLYGLPTKLGVGAARLVGSKLLPTTGLAGTALRNRLYLQSILANAPVSAALGAVSAAGQGEDVGEAALRQGAFGAGLGAAGTLLGRTFPNAIGIKDYSQLDPTAPPAGPSLYSRVKDRLFPPSYNLSEETVQKMDEVLKQEQVVKDLFKGGVNQAVQEGPPLPPGHDIDVARWEAGMAPPVPGSTEARVQQWESALNPAGAAPTAPASVPVPFAEQVRTFVGQQLDDQFANAGFDPRDEVAYGKQYLEALLAGTDKKKLPKPSTPTQVFTKGKVDEWYKEVSDEALRRIKAGPVTEATPAATPATAAAPLAMAAVNDVDLIRDAGLKVIGYGGKLSPQATLALRELLADPARVNALPAEMQQWAAELAPLYPPLRRAATQAAASAIPEAAPLSAAPATIPEPVVTPAPDVAVPPVAAQSADDVLAQVRAELGYGTSPIAARRATPGIIEQPVTPSGPPIRVTPEGEAIAADALPVPIVPPSLPSPYRRLPPFTPSDQPLPSMRRRLPAPMPPTPFAAVEPPASEFALPEVRPPIVPMSVEPGGAQPLATPEPLPRPAAAKAAPMTRAEAEAMKAAGMSVEQVRAELKRRGVAQEAAPEEIFRKGARESEVAQGFLNRARRHAPDLSVDQMLQRLKYEKEAGTKENLLREEMEGLQKIYGSKKFSRLPRDFRDPIRKAVASWEEALTKFSPTAVQEEVANETVEQIVERLRNAGKSDRDIAAALFAKMRTEAALERTGKPEFAEKGIIPSGEFAGLAEVERPEVRESGQKIGADFITKATLMLQQLLGVEKANKMVAKLYPKHAGLAVLLGAPAAASPLFTQDDEAGF